MNSMPVIDPVLRRAADLITGDQWWRGLTVAEVRRRAERALNPRVPLDAEILRLLHELPGEVVL